ncbi:MAG: hypothetical protein AAF690_05910 [Acidobacteriota bacterium]
MTPDPEEPSDIIVLSTDEVGFLMKVTGPMAEDVDADHVAARSSLRRKLESLSVGDAPDDDRFPVEVSRAELALLHSLTKQAYSFITQEERRARLVLREKMVVSSENLSRNTE